MADQSASARFYGLLEDALRNYEDFTMTNWEDSLAIQLRRCHTIDVITTLLQDKTQGGPGPASNDFRQRCRIVKSIKDTVYILTPMSTFTSAADGAGLVRQKVLKACLAFLTVFYRKHSHI